MGCLHKRLSMKIDTVGNEGAPMTDLPELALSVRQPWAWAIIHAGKDIENRSWQAVNHGLRQRGRIAIHAAKGMTNAEYSEAREFIDELGYTCPRVASRWHHRQRRGC